MSEYKRLFWRHTKNTCQNQRSLFQEIFCCLYPILLVLKLLRNLVDVSTEIEENIVVEKFIKALPLLCTA